MEQFTIHSTTKDTKAFTLREPCECPYKPGRVISAKEMENRQAALHALRACQEEAVGNGIDRLSPEALDALIYED